MTEYKYTPEQHRAHCHFPLLSCPEPEGKFDISLLRKAVEWAKAESELERGDSSWDQSTWREVGRCGTTYCVAGFVCEVSGERWSVDFPSWVFDPETKQDVNPGEVAARHLGLYECEANDLFHGSNSIHMVLDYARAFAARRGEELGL